MRLGPMTEQRAKSRGHLDKIVRFVRQLRKP